MKIKHWQGYGCLQANIVSMKLSTLKKEEVICVQVTGNHEYGIDRSEDWYDVYTWLLQRVSRKYKQIEYKPRLVKNVKFNYIPNNEVETGIYEITLDLTRL